MDDDGRPDARVLLARAVEFHGHLGPFVVLGIRMGVVARPMLKAQNHNDLTAIMSVNPKPPVSCMVDGVHVASGCTLGKGTIRVSESAVHIAGEFHAGNRIFTITVKPKLLNWLLNGLRNRTEKGVLETAETVLARPDEELFQITSITRVCVAQEDRAEASGCSWLEPYFACASVAHSPSVEICQSRQAIV